MTINKKRLPDTEFAVMQVIWHKPNPINSSQIMENLPADREWKPQTLLTVLARLVEKGFLSSEKIGKERVYTTLISEEDYLAIETEDFLHRYAGQSIGGFFKTLFSSDSLSKKDLEELKNIVNEGK